MLKLILFEDEDLLVVNKPAGLNTHAPAPFAGEGLFDWLRNREPRWASLSILHRLDKDTSGVMVFGKSTRANRSLADQFERHGVHKRYALLSDRPVPRPEFTVSSALVRAGERYVSRPFHAGADRATTVFRVAGKVAGRTLLEAEPVTGRTHQIRVHAASSGLPILGDRLYGGSPAPRLCLHAASLEFKHPATGVLVRFEASPEFEADATVALRESLIDSDETDAFRLVHGASDGRPGLYVDRLGSFLLAQSELPPEKTCWQSLMTGSVAGAYYKRLDRQVRRASAAGASPLHVLGHTAPDRLTVRENGLRFDLGFQEGYSVGLFLDQRDNRRRLLKNHVAAGFPLLADSASGGRVLNTFAYTCAFSVCAARAGMATTSVDISRKYLDWGRRNFELNQVDTASHEFLRGDVFEWLRRLRKKPRTFEVIILDPPTFSQSKGQGIFRAEQDYGELVTAALPLLASRGVLLASCNAARYAPADFVETVRAAVRVSGRTVLQERYAPQPPDFPISRQEPAYLKTIWLRVR